jgi:hypothetical protein
METHDFSGILTMIFLNYSAGIDIIAVAGLDCGPVIHNSEEGNFSYFLCVVKTYLPDATDAR